MAQHVMLDLETLGTGSDAAILAIGAVKFDPADPSKVWEKFYVAVDPVSAVQCGMKMDPKTVLWWMSEQQDAARKDLLSSEMLDLPSALSGFELWFGTESLPVWGNGAAFDNVILRTAYQKIGDTAPWRYAHDRCYRTLLSLCPDTPHDQDWLKHNALNDAVSQTIKLQKIIETLNLQERFN